MNSISGKNRQFLLIILLKTNPIKLRKKKEKKKKTNPKNMLRLCLFPGIHFPGNYFPNFYVFVCH